MIVTHRVLEIRHAFFWESEISFFQDLWFLTGFNSRFIYSYILLQSNTHVCVGQGIITVIYQRLELAVFARYPGFASLKHLSIYPNKYLDRAIVIWQ